MLKGPDVSCGVGVPDGTVVVVRCIPSFEESKTKNDRNRKIETTARNLNLLGSRMIKFWFLDF